MPFSGFGGLFLLIGLLELGISIVLLMCARRRKALARDLCLLFALMTRAVNLTPIKYINTLKIIPAFLRVRPLAN